MKSFEGLIILNSKCLNHTTIDAENGFPYTFKNPYTFKEDPYTFKNRTAQHAMGGDKDIFYT